MGAELAPPHLLAFYHPLAYNLIDRRLDKVGSDPFPVSVALPIGGNEGLIPLHIGLQLLYPVRSENRNFLSVSATSGIERTTDEATTLEVGLG